MTSDRGMGGHLIDDTEEHLLKLADVNPAPVVENKTDTPADVAGFYESPLDSVEMISPEIADFYRAMEVPDSEPVPGWTLEIPAELCYRASQRGASLAYFTYSFTGDAQEWADENLRDSYWILGPSYVNAQNFLHPAPHTYTAYFTSEHDYILVKMRWG